MIKTKIKDFSSHGVPDSEIVINSGKKLEIGMYLLILGHVIRLRGSVADPNPSIIMQNQ
jgi:hypothetical protein